MPGKRKGKARSRGDEQDKVKPTQSQVEKVQVVDRPPVKEKRKQRPRDPVLLGFPDGPIATAEDNDPYVTKIGGVPVWFKEECRPPARLTRCRVCRDPMFLIFQGYVPLNDSPYHRIMYVWACNRRTCMRKEGSFSVIRSHLVDMDYLAAQKQKEEKKKKKEQEAKKLAFDTGNFQLGSIWGTSSPFGAPPIPKPAEKKEEVKKKEEPDSLSKTFGKLSLQSKQTEQEEEEEKLHDQSKHPAFPGEYLHISEEDLDSYDSFGIDMKRYKEYLDMEREILEQEASEEWSGETYEKQQLPRGFDKQFKKFMERVNCNPQQCVRYEWDGEPLLYHQQQVAGGRCSACGGPRVFEMQLMPTILSVLPISEYATAEDNKDTGNKRLNLFDVGMEFGTILIYVCAKDCHQGDIEKVTFVEELAIVQHEID